MAVTVAGNTGDVGPWSYQFSSPTAITFDQDGYMYIMDAGNDRVQRWYSGGTFGITVAKTTMATPQGLEFDRYSNLVIADTSYHRVLLFGLTCRKFELDFQCGVICIFVIAAASTTTTTAPPSLFSPDYHSAPNNESLSLSLFEQHNLSFPYAQLLFGIRRSQI